MTQLQARRILRDALLRLTRVQLGRLVWHAENKTPICCGKLAACFIHDGGA